MNVTFVYKIQITLRLKYLFGMQVQFKSDGCPNLTWSKSSKLWTSFVTVQYATRAINLQRGSKFSSPQKYPFPLKSYLDLILGHSKWPLDVDDSYVPREKNTPKHARDQ